MEGKGILNVLIEREGKFVKIRVPLIPAREYLRKSCRGSLTPLFTTKDHGTGLGLAIVYSIIEKHKGKIELHNTSENGSTFVSALPGGE